jgi:hypothetical protein
MPQMNGCHLGCKRRTAEIRKNLQVDLNRFLQT